MARLPRPKSIDPWIAPLRAALADPQMRSTAIRAIATLGLPQFDDDLGRIAGDASISSELRLEALRTRIPRSAILTPQEFQLISNQANPSPSTRLMVAEIASRAELDAAQTSSLLQVFARDPLISPDTLMPLLSRSARAEAAGPLLDYLN